MSKMKMIKSVSFILLLAVLAAALFRLYRISEFPVQLNHDEVTQLYDAISIAETGRDIYGNFLPTVFESVHDFKPPFYTYITSLTYLLAGGGESTIRVPSVFFGILTVVGVFFFTLMFLKDKNIALISAFITAISPFEIFFSRKSFENGTGIFFMLVGFSLLMHFIRNSSRIGLYTGLLALVLGMYTYFSQAVVIPLQAILFFVIFRKEFLTALRQRLRTKKRYLFTALTFLILILPLIYIVLANSGSRYRSQTVFITQDLNLVRQINFTKTENLISPLLYLKAVGDFSFNRYLNQFNPSYLFGNGLDLTNQGPLGSGPLFSVPILFILLGVYWMVKNPDLIAEKKFLTAWVLIGILPSGITFEPFSPHRSMMVFTVLNIITAFGIYEAVKMFRKIKAIGIIFAAIFIFQFIYFLHIYFVNYPFEKSQNLQYPFKEVAKYAWSKRNDFDQVIFDPVFGQAAPVIGTGAHYYFGYFGNFSPVKMQEEYRIGAKEREVLFDKFSIRKIEWNEDINLKKSLLILSPWSVDPKILDKNNDRIIKTFYFYDHQPAFYAVKSNE